MQKLELNAWVGNHRFVFKNEDRAKKDMQKFFEHNEGRRVHIMYDAQSEVEHHQHRFYWGYLLPDITFAMGEKDEYYVHVLLKRDFLYRPVESGKIEDIPKKYFRNGIFMIGEDKLADLENHRGIPFSLIHGVIIVTGKDDSLRGYIPSNADLTYDEKEEYHRKCEDRLMLDLNNHLGVKSGQQQEAMEVRELSMGEDPAQGKMFQ